MSLVRPMRSFEDDDVAEIHRLCHPTFPKPPARWFEAHPTLVIQSEGEIVGYTSYSVVMKPDVCPDGGEAMIGYGIDVKPGHQGKGYGRELFQERLRVARLVGAKVFVGHASPDNLSMIHLFEAEGFKPMSRVKDGYPDGTDMLLFMGPI